MHWDFAEIAADGQRAQFKRRLLTLITMCAVAALGTYIAYGTTRRTYNTDSPYVRLPLPGNLQAGVELHNGSCGTRHARMQVGARREIAMLLGGFAQGNGLEL